MESEALDLDPQTFKDLEIFESDAGTCLFDVCNVTRTEGGAHALRRRMERPWSTAARIRSTQESISFILAHRPVFAPLLRLGYTTNRVERYLNEIVQPLVQASALEFSIRVAELWLNRNRDYNRIVRGVEVTCRLIRDLRRFVARSTLDGASGELSAIRDEMRELLGHDALRTIPNAEIEGYSAWRILRIDQTLRVYEAATISRLLELTYQIDALVSLADVTGKHGFLIPELADGPLSIRAEGLTHPMVQNAVPNPVELNQQQRLLFLTGPNMAGKTTYLRALAVAVYFAHLGMGVPAQSFRFTPAQRLFSSISLNDDLQGGISYFRAEALRVKAIAEAIATGHRVLALLDEPFKGTNVKDALDASQVILERLAIRADCLFVFSSHLIELSQKLDAIDQIFCCHFEADEHEGRLQFGYLLRPGVSSQRLGMRVLREEGIFDVLDSAT